MGPDFDAIQPDKYTQTKKMMIQKIRVEEV